MREGTLKDLQFFNNKDDSFVAMIVPFFQPLHYGMKEIIYKVHEYPTSSKNIFPK